MHLAVIRPALRRRRDHQRLAALRDRQRAVYVGDVVVRRHIDVAVLHHRRTRHVLLRPDIRDRARYRDTLHGVRSLQTFRRGILPSVVRQRRAVVFLAVAVRSDRQRRLVDRQLAGGKVLFGIVVCPVFSTIHDRIRLGKAAGIRTAFYVGSLRRGVGDGQNIALAETFHRVIIGRNGLACAGDSGHKRTAFLLGAVIDLLNVVDRNLQGRRFYLQGAQGRVDLIVRGLVLAPVDAIGVVAAAHRRLGASHREGDGLAGPKGHRTRTSGFRLGPLAADVGRPIAVVQRGALALGERGAVVGLLVAGRADGQRQRHDREEAVAGVERDRIVRVAHHLLTVDRHASDLCLLRCAGHGIGARILLGDQRAICAIQRAPDRVAVLRLEEIALAAGDADISRLTRIVIEVLLARVGEADVERLAGVVVRAGAAGVRVPLVSADADVHADRLHRQGARHVDDAVVGLGRSRSRCAKRNNCALRRGGAGAGVGLGPVKLQARQRIAARDAGHGVVRCNVEAAEQRRAVVGLGLVVGDDDQLLLIVDVDHQVAFIAGNLVGRLGRRGGAGQIGMVVHEAVRRLVLHGEGVALLDIAGISGMDGVAVHVEVVDRDLRRGIGNILEGDHVVLEGQLQLLRRLGGPVVLAEDVGVRGLGRQVIRINLHRLLQRVRGGAGNGDGLGLMHLDLSALQDIVHRIGDLVRDGVIVEDDGVVLFVEGKRYRFGSLVRHVTGNGRGILGDCIALLEIRIGDDLVVQNLGGRALLVVVHGIADGVLRPVGVEGDVLRHRLVPVVGGAGLVRRGEPALEGIVRPRRIIRHFRIEAVLVRLCLNRRAALGIEGNRAGREFKRSVEHQACGHLGAAGIGACVLLIGIPALPGRAIHGGGRNVIGQVAGDVIPKGNILRADQSTVIVVEGQRVVFSIIVEVEASIYCRVCIIRPPSRVILAEKRSPVVCEIAISTILRPACRRSIPSLGITGDLIPVIHIAEVVIPHVDRLHAAIGLAVVGRRRVAIGIVLQPVLQVLIIAGTIRLTV